MVWPGQYAAGSPGEVGIWQEFRRYLGQNWNSENDADPRSGSYVVEGAHEEDTYDPLLDTTLPTLFCSHFWDPDRPDDSLTGLSSCPGTLPYEASLYDAELYWLGFPGGYYHGEVISAFPSLNQLYSDISRRHLAYYFLGRIAHLLADSTVPAHVLDDNHAKPFDSDCVIDADYYEGFTRDTYSSWPATGPAANASDLRTLFKELGQRTQYFPSDGCVCRNCDPPDQLSCPDRLGNTVDENGASLQHLFVAWPAVGQGQPIDPYQIVCGPATPASLDHSELFLIADKLMPLAFRYTAGLYKLFWKSVHPPVNSLAGRVVGNLPTLQWNPPAAGVQPTFYRIYRREDSPFPSEEAPPAGTYLIADNVTNTQFVDPAPPPAGAYYMVTAVEAVTYPDTSVGQNESLASDSVFVGACNPSSPEFCDGRDNDCDGLIDEVVDAQGSVPPEYWDAQSLPSAAHIVADIWSSATGDVYAVGQSGGSQGFIYHWDGTSWRSIPEVEVADGFYSIWGATSSDIYAVGALGRIFHYDGSTWSEEIHPAGSRHLRSVWGVSPNDVYVVGDRGTILRNATGSWNILPFTNLDASLHVVWASSSTCVYVAGVSSSGGGIGIHRFDGTRWRSPIDAPGEITGLWGTACNDFFAVGNLTQTDGVIYHCTDTRCERICIGADRVSQIWSVSGSGDAVYVAGYNATVAYIDGSSCRTLSIGDGSNSFLYGLWASSPCNVYTGGVSTLFNSRCSCIDSDGDGVAPPGDCSDSDPTRFPGAPELCDRLDNDCDGVADDGHDKDLDGIVDCLDICPMDYNPDQVATAYVTNQTSPLLAIDILTGTRVVLGLDPFSKYHGVSLSQAFDTAYVTDGVRIFQLDLATHANTVVGSTDVFSLRGLAEHEGRKVLAVDFNSGVVVEVDPRDSSVHAVASGLLNPWAIASMDDGHALVSEIYEGNLSRVDLKTGQVEVIQRGLVLPVGIAVDTAQAITYLAEAGSGRILEVKFNPVAVSPIVSGLDTPVGIGLDRGGRSAFVTEYNAGRLAKVDLSTGTTIPVASELSYPDGVVVTTDIILKVFGSENTVLVWQTVPQSISYDVVRGDLHQLYYDGVNVHLGEITCLEDDSLDTTTGAGTEPARVDSDVPPLGEGFFYLVRHNDGRNAATYGYAAPCTIKRVVDAGDCTQ
ncbi:MAG: hypothetical protein HY613_01535 [Candidatus Rokubacteria bacterium]|nr:hypothetical protein [Candidatus Rokubacteria bacterium]